MEQYRGDVSANYLNLKDVGLIVKHDKCTDIDGSYSFGWFWLEVLKTGEKWMEDFYISDENESHGDIEIGMIDSWAEEQGIDPIRADKLVRLRYGKRGRVWPNEKIFIFDQNGRSNPTKQEMLFIIKELEAETGIDIDWDEYKIYFSDCVDPYTETNEWRFVNEYTLREYITGVMKGTGLQDPKEKANASDFVLSKLSGEKKYQDALVNDPRMDKMYRNFVAEGKKIIMTESQARFLIRKIKKG